MCPLMGHHRQEAGSFSETSIDIRHREISLGGLLAQNAKDYEEGYRYSSHSESPWVWIGDVYYAGSTVSAIPGWGTGATASAARVGRGRATANASATGSTTSNGAAPGHVAAAATAASIAYQDTRNSDREAAATGAHQVGAGHAAMGAGMPKASMRFNPAPKRL